MNTTPDPSTETVPALRSRFAQFVIEWAIATEEGASASQALARIVGGAQPGKEGRWISSITAFFLLGLGLGLELFMFSH